MVLVHVQPVFAGQAGAFARQMKQPSDQLRQLCGLLRAHDAHHRNAARFVGAKQMIDHGFAHRAGLSYRGFDVHEQAWAGVDFNDSAFGFAQRP